MLLTINCGFDTPPMFDMVFTESNVKWCKNFQLNHLAEFYRIGEAKNPGPSHKDELVNTICVYNPSGMHNKHLFFLEHLQRGIS